MIQAEGLYIDLPDIGETSSLQLCLTLFWARTDIDRGAERRRHITAPMHDGNRPST
jgi:hypothetical protein